MRQGCSPASATQVSVAGLVSEEGFYYQKRGLQVCGVLVFLSPISWVKGYGLLDIPEKSLTLGLEAGLGARVRHFSARRGSSSVLNLVQFLRAFRRKSRGFSEVEHESKKSCCCNNNQKKKKRTPLWNA